MGRPSLRDLLPEEVAQLLGAVAGAPRVIARIAATTSSSIAAIRRVEAFLDERREVLGRSIIPSSIFFALRQKGSFASLKIFSIMVRLLPR